MAAGWAFAVRLSGSASAEGRSVDVPGDARGEADYLFAGRGGLCDLPVAEASIWGGGDSDSGSEGR